MSSKMPERFKGAKKVVAKVDTRMGISDKYVPKGTTGVGYKYKPATKSPERWAVWWGGVRGEASHNSEDIRFSRTKN